MGATSEMRKNIDWFTSCGRTWLSVNGYVAAVEGDQCRDANLQRQFDSENWTSEMIQFVAEKNAKEDSKNRNVESECRT